MIFYSITLHRIKKEKYMLNVTNDIIHIIEEKLKKNKNKEQQKNGKIKNKNIYIIQIFQRINKTVCYNNN